MKLTDISHPFEHLNYIISGRGTLYGKDCHRGIGAGDCILVKPNEMHQYKNSSAKSAFVFICLVPKENECGCPDKEEENEEVQS
jgi:quercetin dioxygenase-like cupin family protein